MASWARQRRSIYAAIAIAVLIVAAGIPAYKYFYKAPSCFDGVQDGNELGIDCGGSCQRLCPSAFLPPSVSWTRLEQVAPGLYNVAAYVVNPNPDAEATGTPYHMALYDGAGSLITDVYGTMTLPPHRNALAFQGSVNVGKRTPVRATFDFTAAPNWVSSQDTLAPLSVVSKDYTEDASGSSLSVALKDESAEALGPMWVSAVLYDQDGNEVGFSRTEIDSIGPGQTVTAPFTWPEDRNGSVVSIEVLPVAE